VLDLRCLLDFRERARLVFLDLGPDFLDPRDFLDLVVKVTLLPLAMNETLAKIHRTHTDRTIQTEQFAGGTRGFFFF